MKKLIILCLGMILLTSVSIAQLPPGAQGGWRTCMVNEAGILGQEFSINLSEINGMFVEEWVMVDSPYQKQFLMMALTALTNGLLVRVYISQDRIIGMNLMVESYESNPDNTVTIPQ